MKRIFLLSLLILLSACAAPVPRDPPSGAAAQVPPPRIQAGAEWTYQVRDGYTGLTRPTERYRVTEAGGDRVTVTVSRQGGGDEIQVYDGQWNWLKHRATNMQVFDYSPAYPAFAFPLTAGRKWSTRLTATDPASGRSFPVTVDGVAMGWERVRVPAGEFEALKVSRTVYLDYYESTVRGQSVISEIEWYAPAVNQAVRREAKSRYFSFLAREGAPGFLPVRMGGRDRDGGPRFVPDDWLIYELVAYTAR